MTLLDAGDDGGLLLWRSVHGCCVGVMRIPGRPFDSAWCLVCEVCRLTVDCVDCRCFLSFVFLGDARRLELSPCNTRKCSAHPMDVFLRS